MVDTDDTQRTPDDRRRTMPWVWHKLPTGELTNGYNLVASTIIDDCDNP